MGQRTQEEGGGAPKESETGTSRKKGETYKKGREAPRERRDTLREEGHTQGEGAFLVKYA